LPWSGTGPNRASDARGNSGPQAGTAGRLTLSSTATINLSVCASRSGCAPRTNEGYIFPYGRRGIEATTPIHRTGEGSDNQTVPRRLDDELSSDIVFIGETRNTLGVRLRVRGIQKPVRQQKRCIATALRCDCACAFALRVIHRNRDLKRRAHRVACLHGYRTAPSRLPHPRRSRFTPSRREEGPSRRAQSRDDSHCISARVARVKC